MSKAQSTFMASLLLLTGCQFHHEVKPEQIQRAQAMCANNGGVEHYVSVANSEIGVSEVICNNGAHFEWTAWTKK